MGPSADAKVKIGILSVAPSTGAVVYDGTSLPLQPGPPPFLMLMESPRWCRV